MLGQDPSRTGRAPHSRPPWRVHDLRRRPGRVSGNPATIDVAFLDRYEPYREFRNRRAAEDGAGGAPEPAADTSTETPKAVLERAHETLNDALAAELLDEIADHTPAFFEKLVLDLMMAT